MVSKKAVDSSPFVRLQEFLAVSGASRRPVDKILISLSDPESALSPDNENVFCPMYMAQILTDAKSLQILGMSLSNIPLSIEPDDRSKSTDRGLSKPLGQTLFTVYRTQPTRALEKCRLSRKARAFGFSV